MISEHATKNNTLTYTYTGTQPIEYVGDDGSGIRAKLILIEKGVNWEFEDATWTTDAVLGIEVPSVTGRPLRDLVAPQEQNYSMNGRYGETYNSTWIRTHSSCKPSETYQWGFSYIFLFMVSIFNFLWSLIMIAMWLDTRCGSRMYKSGRRPGFLRSVLDLAAAVREELGPDAEVLEEEELRKRLTMSGGRMEVPKGELRVRRVGTKDANGSRMERTWTGGLTRGSSF